jgi:tetratricopeptide (TPR) repeat protein
VFRFFGTMPLDEFLDWLDEPGSVGAKEVSVRARALAGQGRFDEARKLLADATAKMAEQGAQVRLAAVLSQDAIEVELLAGNPARAVELGEQGCKLFEEIGERGYLSTSAGMLAEAYYELGRLDEAQSWARRAKDLGSSDDAATQLLWRLVEAKVLARRAEHEQGRRLARDAVSIAERTSMLKFEADAYAALAEVLELAGEDPRPALEQALERYARKGNVVMAERTRERLAELVS